VSEQEELRLLREEVRKLIDLHLDEQQEIELLKEIRDSVRPKKLAYIKIAFLKGDTMAEGPVKLTIGQKTIASVDGFDQNGAPFTGPIPTPSWSIDTPATATAVPDATNPANEDVTAVAAGTANLSVMVTSAEGKSLTDTEVVTVVASAPVLSSVKINFSTPV
jgi:hypothetical protein